MNTGVIDEIIRALDITTDKENYYSLIQVHKLAKGESEKIYDF
jgi:hypothetical protein